jgi:rhodanese-related sulfurtransferase
MSPEDLAKRLMDLPGTLDVVDIRPAWQYAEYHLPGSVNVPVQELMANPAFLNDKRPLVIVCRDGSISAAVGGALVQKSQRPIRFLNGGVMRYYDEVARPTGIVSDGMPPSVPGAPAQAPQVKPEPPAPPGPPKKKSAGC